jgi:MFS transporter, DHA2 family, multidrug resistance protein
MNANRSTPVINPWLIAVSVMLATFMETLDTSIANVSLPHIAGNLSASTDEATWVITSYLLSNAIILPASGWLSRYFGRKRLLMTCVSIFTFSSLLCGMAPTLGLLIFARVLQGAGGGALQPLSQAIMLESFPKEKRGMAMAVYTMGVVVAPIMGPLAGGWITDNYAWRWIFYINIPVGLFALMMMRRFIHDPAHIRDSKPDRIDGIGFGLMAIGLATLQIILDKGQEDDWFGAVWIRWTALICVVALVAFLLWERQTEHPIVDLRVLANRNFAVGTFMVIMVGMVVYVPATLLPQFLQGLMGYTAFDSGMAQCSRGMGVMLTIFPVGYLVSRVDSRKLIGVGFFIAAISIFWLSHINLDMAITSIQLPLFLQGIGMAFVFVPLTTTTVGMLTNQQMGNATGIYNLMRNIGGSIGISIATTFVARHAQDHQNTLVAHFTPYDAAYTERLQTLQTAFGTPHDPSVALANIYQTLIQQATTMAYVDTFRWLALLCLIATPAVIFFKKVQSRGAAAMAH